MGRKEKDGLMLLPNDNGFYIHGQTEASGLMGGFHTALRARPKFLLIPTLLGFNPI